MVSKRKKLLVLGAGGLLGCAFCDYLGQGDWNVLRHARNRENSVCANLANASETELMLNKEKPDAILNLVGLTDVDSCERFPNEAYLANIKTIENIVAWIKRYSEPVQLVHISTDQVYDGAGPHEESGVCLKNYYAFSKYAGELVACSVESTVLRTNFFGRSKCNGRLSLTDWIYTSLLKKQEIGVFDDVLFSPLSISSVCQNIYFVLNNKVTGLFNLGARRGMTKADFAYRFASALELDTSLMSRRSVGDLESLFAYRPRDMRLDLRNYESVTGVLLPDLEAELEKVLGDYEK